MSATSGPLLDELGRRGVLQLLVEGGASVADVFHRAGLVDQYVLYLAPALLGGDDGVPLFAGPGAARWPMSGGAGSPSCRRLGPDLRIDLLAANVRVPYRERGVHRDRRGAGPLARRAPPRAAAPAFAAPTVAEGGQLGDSIAVNGCCLTVVELGRGLVGCRRRGRDPGPHQPRRPAARATRSTSSARCALGGRLGGHLVQGHVDAVGDVVTPGARPARSGPDARLPRYLVEKGSVTVDGISLTVVERGRRRLHGGRHPPHRGGHHPRAPRRRATGSTWRST